MNSVVSQAVLSFHDLEINVQYKLVKNITLRVKHDGSIYVSAPCGMSVRILEYFLQEKEAWLKNKLATMRMCGNNTLRYRMGELPFDGKHVWIWGEKLPCFFVHQPGAEPMVERKEQEVYFYCPEKLNEQRQAVVVERYYEQLVKSSGKKFLDAWQRKIGVRYTSLKVHRTKTRWGSCNVRTGGINLNTLLACWPKDCLEYIVVHELTHLLEANHSLRFYELVTKFLPLWKLSKRKLEQIKPI